MFFISSIYKYFSIVLLLVTFFLLGFLLIGGASNESAYSSIYLLRLSYNETQTQKQTLEASAYSNISAIAHGLKVRSNYLTLCASTAGNMVCTTSTNLTRLDPTLNIQSGDSAQKVSLVAIASALKHVCKPHLLIATLALVLLMIVVSLWSVMPFVPGKLLAKKLCTGTALLTCLIWGLGAMLQHQAIVGAQAFVEAATQQFIHVERGKKAEALSWTSFSFLVTSFFALSFRLFREHRREVAQEGKF